MEFYNKDGLIKYRIETQEGVSGDDRPDSLLTDEEAQRHDVEVEMIKAARKADQNTALKPEERFIQKKDIDALLPSLSSSSISRHFKILCDEKILIMHGTGKGAKYYLNPDLDSFPKDR